MSHLAPAASIIFAAILGVSCVSVEETSRPDVDARPMTAAPTNVPLPTTTVIPPGAPASVSPLACNDKRWIGVRNAAGKCVAATGWTVKPLIDGPAPPPHGTGDDDSVLGDYCVYEWDAGGTPATDKLPSGLDRDCFVTAGHGTATQVEKLVQEVLMDAHQTQMEMPITPIASASGVPIDVAVLDTWASQANAGRSNHGFAMAGIIEGVACGAMSAPCRVRVRPFLALDRFGDRFERDLINGGTYGSQAQLARSIHDALTAPGVARRVLTIAAGWDSRYNASTAQPGRPSHAVRAVGAALRLAACSGAIVITSAGNDTGGPSPGDGPIFPAAYESKRAPLCTGVVRPLVWSAGGVDGRDLPIANTRPNARPTLAAPSFAVPSVNQTTTATDIVGPFTGTSVSAADVAAIAALVWHIDGNLLPHQVMQIIGASAEPLGETADYCVAPTCGEIRRVSVCRAMALAGAAVSCPAPITLGMGQNPDLSEITPALASYADARASGIDLRLASDAGGECSVPTRTNDLTLDAMALCPSEVMSNDLFIPALDPQPPKNPCPACTMTTWPFDDLVLPGDMDLAISLVMPISLEIGVGRVAIPHTMTLTLGGQIIDRIDLGSAKTTQGASLSTGLLAGETYEVLLESEDPLVYGTDYDAVTIEWVNTRTYLSSYPVVEAK